MKRVILSLIISFTLIAVLLCGFFIFRDVYLTYQAQIEEQPSEEPTEPGGEDKPNDEPEEPTEPGGEDKPSDEPEAPGEEEGPSFDVLADFLGGYALCESNEQGIYEEGASIFVAGSYYNLSYHLTEDGVLTPYYWLYRGTYPVTTMISELCSSKPSYKIVNVEKLSNGFKLISEEDVEIILYSPLMENNFNFSFDLTVEGAPSRVLIIDGVVYADLGYEWFDVSIPTVSIEEISELFGTYYHCNLQDGVYVKDTASGAELFKLGNGSLERTTLNLFGKPLPVWTTYFSYESSDFKLTDYNQYTCEFNGGETAVFCLYKPFLFEQRPSKVLIIGDEIYACFD